MLGLAILLAFNLAGVLLHDYARVPLPGSVLGLILLATALFSGVVKLAWVETAADLLVSNMLLFFAPVIVGILPMEHLVRQELAAFVVTTAGSLYAVMLATGWTAAGLMALRRPRKAGARDGK